MSDITVRQAVRDLSAYVVEPPDFPIIVNANENPDDLPMPIKKQIADAKRVNHLLSILSEIKASR